MTVSTLVNRRTASAVFMAWNAGCVRYFDGFKLRDMGLMSCKEQAQEWCRVNGVRFLDELPERWVGLARQRARMPLVRTAGRQSKCV